MRIFSSVPNTPASTATASQNYPRGKAVAPRERAVAGNIKESLRDGKIKHNPPPSKNGGTPAPQDMANFQKVLQEKQQNQLKQTKESTSKEAALPSSPPTQNTKPTPDEALLNPTESSLSKIRDSLKSSHAPFSAREKEILEKIVNQG